MTYEIEKNGGKITFASDEPFNVNLLVDIQEIFRKLSNKEPIEFEIIGEVPVEAAPYLISVSDYCDLTLVVHDDKCRRFMETLAGSANSSIKIKGNI